MSAVPAGAGTLAAATAGRPFVKMSGSGNDFVFIDARDALGDDPLETPAGIRALCARGTGVGADGVVFLGAARTPGAALEIRYYNSDGSRASLCGNATLCATRLAVTLGVATEAGFALETDSGRLAARLQASRPQIDLRPVAEVREEMTIDRVPGERRIGFALAGVPHLVVLDDDVDAVDVGTRGAALRRHPAAGAAGANVNFVSASGDGTWRIRTFERGVEGETLACGTGAVAAAVLLTAWGETSDPVVALRTRSGSDLVVTVRRDAGVRQWLPSLAGEGRIVFHGTLGELPSG